MSDLGGRNFHVMTIGLNLPFIGEEIHMYIHFRLQNSLADLTESRQCN